MAADTGPGTVLNGGAALRSRTVRSQSWRAQNKAQHTLSRSNASFTQIPSVNVDYTVHLFIRREELGLSCLCLKILLNETLQAMCLQQKTFLMSSVNYQTFINFIESRVTTTRILGNRHRRIIFRPTRPQANITQ